MESIMSSLQQTIKHGHVESLFDDALELAATLLRSHGLGGLKRRSFCGMAERLAALPLATVEYAVISQRLKNALVYCQQEERGAAAFELRLLIGHLRQERARLDSHKGSFDMANWATSWDDAIIVQS
jgi:hypothetical protein